MLFFCVWYFAMLWPFNPSGSMCMDFALSKRVSMFILFINRFIDWNLVEIYYIIIKYMYINVCSSSEPFLLGSLVIVILRVQI